MTITEPTPDLSSMSIEDLPLEVLQKGYPTGVQLDQEDLARRLLKLIPTLAAEQSPAPVEAPADRFLDPKRFAAEQEFLRSRPHLVALSGALPGPSSYLALTVMGTPILLTRDRDGALHAFRNSCRHRGMQVASGCGVRRRFSCPWHGWVYDERGELQSMNHAEGFEGMDRSKRGLIEITANEHDGFIYVRLDGNGEAEPDPDTAEVRRMLSTLNPQQWHHIDTTTLPAKCNWKLALDTYTEGYHVQFIHPQTVAKFLLPHAAAFDRYGKNWRICFATPALKELADVPEENWPDPLQLLGYVYGIFPNTMVIVSLSHVEIFRVEPGANVGESVTYHSYYSAQKPETDEERAVHETLLKVLDFVIEVEDYKIASGVQEALGSGGIATFMLGANEPGLQHMHKVVDEAIAARLSASVGSVR